MQHKSHSHGIEINFRKNNNDIGKARGEEGGKMTLVRDEDEEKVMNSCKNVRRGVGEQRPTKIQERERSMQIRTEVKCQQNRF